MAICKKIRRTNEIICSGSLNRLITIQVRELKPPTGDSVDYGEEFTTERNVWAMVEIVANETFFDHTNTERIITHNFYIRYISDVEITSENWIKYNNQYYDIVDVKNMGYNDRFMQLRTNIRGQDNLPVNWA